MLAAQQLPRAATIHIDGRVARVHRRRLGRGRRSSAACRRCCGCGCRTLTPALREGDTRTGSGGARRFGNGLVVAEIAVAFALLVGAGLLVKNLVLLERRDAGIHDRSRRRLRRLAVGPALQGRAARSRRSIATLDARLAQVGGVQSVGADQPSADVSLRLQRRDDARRRQPWGANDNPLVEYRWLYGDYLKTLGIPLLRGRTLDTRRRRHARACSSTRRWPTSSGPARIRSASASARAATPRPYYTVGRRRRQRPLVRPGARNAVRVLPHDRPGRRVQSMTVVIRTRGDRSLVADSHARAASSSILDPNLPVTGVQTMEEVVSASVGQPRLLSALSRSVRRARRPAGDGRRLRRDAYNVRRQRREFGIRLALGADPGAVQRLIVAPRRASAAAGIAIGCVGGLLLTRVLATMLNDVQADGSDRLPRQRRHHPDRLPPGVLRSRALGRKGRSRLRASTVASHPFTPHRTRLEIFLDWKSSTSSISIQSSAWRPRPGTAVASQCSGSRS